MSPPVHPSEPVRPMPAWLKDILASADADEGVLNKRQDGRRTWSALINARVPGPGGKSLTVTMFNLSNLGLGIISRTKLVIGDRLLLTPVGQPGEPVTVRIVHCTQTIQGFKVGCRFD